jgi:hypothetical protein
MGRCSRSPDLPTDLVEDDVRQRGPAADHGGLHECPVARIAFELIRRSTSLPSGQVSTASGNTSSSPSRAPVAPTNAGPPPHKVITLSVAASLQLRSLKQVMERSESPPSTGSTPSHRPTNDRSLSACAEDADATGSKATKAKTRNRLIEPSLSVEFTSLQRTSAGPVRRGFRHGAERDGAPVVREAAATAAPECGGDASAATTLRIRPVGRTPRRRSRSASHRAPAWSWSARDRPAR